MLHWALEMNWNKVQYFIIVFFYVTIFTDTMYILLYYIVLDSMYDNVYIHRIVTYLGCMDRK